MEVCRKHRKTIKRCIKERKKERNCPTYENEHSIYQKEISLKIEEFRLARKNWLESRKEDETIKAEEKDGLHDTSIYRGRFTRLKKIGLNTMRLREHYQTVKPLPYFTLKPEISRNYENEKMERERQRAQWELARLAELEWFDQDTMLKDKKEQIWQEKEKEIKEYVEDFVKEKKKKKRKGPSQKAIENLKASKQADRLFETCKCNDRKEVTVVIKGFCLCDKGNLNTLKLNKISDDIRKMEAKPEPGREEREPHVVDSIEIHRKQIHGKPTMTEKKEVEEVQKFEMTRSKSEKSVSFGQSTINEERHNEWKLEKDEQKREPEKRREEKLNKWLEDKRKEQEEKEQEKRRKEQEKRRQKQEEKEQEERRKERQEEEKVQEENSKGKEKEKLRIREEEKEKSRNEDDASVITLFRNSVPEKSEMALTREQLQKLKEIPE